MERLQLVPVATGLSDFEAKVLTARLGAEGFIWQVRGVVDSVYPLGGIDVLVQADEADEAAVLVALVLGGDADADRVGEPEADAEAAAPDAAPSGYRSSWWFGAALVGAVALFVAMRLFTIG